MSDPATSGESTPASPDTASAAPAAGATQPFGTFGSNRGSGLARGKRPTPAAAAATAAPAGYQPSSIEVINPKSEYKNPFTGETSVAAPVVNEPAPAPAVAPAPVAPVPAAPESVAPQAEAAPAPVAVVTPAPAPTSELFPLDPSAPAAKPEIKPELNILPPAEIKRPAQSWESGAQPRRDDRPSFRPERREPRSFEPRAPREGGEQRDQRPQQPRPQPAAQPKATGGFFAWLKGLFGGASTPAGKPEQPGEQRRDRDGEFRHGRRRHRGGRGRHQGFNGPRDGQPGPGGSAEGGRPEGGRPEGQGGDFRQGDEGGQRRRRRGGRGRFRGERGSDPRPDGQQGGGAI